MSKKILLFLLLSLSFTIFSQDKKNPQRLGAHDTGPDKMTQKEFIDLLAESPYNAKLSEELTRGQWIQTEIGPVYVVKQKFRTADGDIYYKGLTEKNSIKSIVVGQEGTHQAVGGNYPGTSGFGGRVQNFNEHLGIYYSYHSMNTFNTTIKGQYAANHAPYFIDGKIQFGNIVPNDMWLMAHDKNSHIQNIRSDRLEWLIENNPESLQLIITYGGAARDSVGSYIERNGGKVGSRLGSDIDKVKVPEFYLKWAGGNNEFPVAFDKNGNDLYEKLLGRKLDYSKLKDQKDVLKFLKQNPELAYKNMIFSDAGVKGSGLIHHAQLSGYDIDDIRINGNKASRSLKGFVHKKSGYQIKKDILILSMKHPTFLAYAERDTRNAYIQKELLKTNEGQALLEEMGGKINKRNIESFVQQGLGKIDKELASEVLRIGIEKGKEIVRHHMKDEMDILKAYRDAGLLSIEPDMKPDGTLYKSHFALKQGYRFGKSKFTDNHFMAGMSNIKKSNSANARRGKYKVEVDGKLVNAGPNIIVMGDRAVPGTDKKKMNALLLSQPNEMPTERYILRRAESKIGRYISDKSIPEYLYELIKRNDFSELYREKEGLSFSKDGIKAFNIKSHPAHGHFGEFRGKFEKPKIIILADPDGWDEFTTSRAMTGTRGQYLQGMMNDIGIGDDYLVLRTVPFQMDGATAEEWDLVRELTQSYRETLLNAVLNNTEEPTLFLSDGPQAQRELERILTKEQKKRFVSISRRGNGKYRANNGSGIEKAVNEIARKFPEFQGVEARVEMNNIPRTHLPYLADMWWGTSGDTTLNATGKMKGLVVQTVRPLWTTDKEVKVTLRQKRYVKKSLDFLRKNGFPMPNESIPDFIIRKAQMLKNKCSGIYGSKK